MTSVAHASTISKKRLLSGYMLTGLAGLFLTLDAIIKVLMLGPAVQGTTELGYGSGAVLWIGVVELVCVGFYLARSSTSNRPAYCRGIP